MAMGIETAKETSRSSGFSPQHVEESDVKIESASSSQSSQIVDSRNGDRWAMYFELFCILSGPMACLLFFVGLIGARLFPPMKAHLSMEHVAKYYLEHHEAMKAGAVLVMLSSIFYILWASIMATHIRRVSGGDSVAWMIQAVCGAFGAITFLLPGMLLAVAAYRPDRDPNVIYLMNDFFWIVLVSPWQPFAPQALSFSFAVLTDRSAKPMFPRWLGYFNLVILIFYTPATGLHFVYSGPISWAGAFGYWVPAVAFGFQFSTDAFMLWKAVKAKYAPK